MFGTSRRPALGNCHPSGSPWDEETLAFIAKHDRLSVAITHLDRVFSDGRIGRGHNHNAVWDVTGIGFLDYSWLQHVHVTIEFGHVDGFGIVILSYQLEQTFQGEPVHVPTLNVVLRNDNKGAQQALIECHRDALLSGRSTSQFGFWHDPLHSDWIERRDGFPYSGRFPIIPTAFMNDPYVPNRACRSR